VGNALQNCRTFALKRPFAGDRDATMVDSATGCGKIASIRLTNSACRTGPFDGTREFAPARANAAPENRVGA